MINEIEALANKKSDLFLNIVGLTKELHGPDLLTNTMILAKESLMGQLKSLKVVWDNEFTETI
jgi:hypothetical protein